MHDAFAKRLKDLNMSPNTIRNYLVDLRMAEKQGIITQNLSIVDMQKLLSLNASVATKRRMRSSIRKYARFLVAQSVIPNVPSVIDAIDLPKTTKNVPRITKSKESKALLKRIKDPEMALVISILATTGCRISSLADLKIEDFSTNSILFRTCKGGKPYTSLITDKIKVYLKTHIGSRISGYVFLNNRGKKATPDSLRRKLYKKLGKDYVNPHSFRHGMATELVTNGVPLITVKMLLNHSSVTVTEQYIHLAPPTIDELKGKHPFLP